jgi:MYXO-CTERM domain-containing protein
MMKRTVLGGLAALILAVPAHGQWLRVSSAEVDQPGQSAEVCVSLESRGKTIAGTQNDLTWDEACATLQTEGDCTVAPDIGKDLHGRLLGRVVGYRGLVLSLDDVDPIPDGTLYCCRFRVEAMAHSCCAVSLENVGLSDDLGNQVGVAAGPPAQLCVGPFDGTPFASFTPTPTSSPILTSVPFTPCPPDFCVRGPNAEDGGSSSVSADSGGCHVTTGSRSGGMPVLLLVLALLLLRRRS